MKNVTNFILFFLPQFLLGAIGDPNQSIAKTYHVGIVDINKHSCLSKINQELVQNSYNTKQFSNLNGSALEFAKQNNLDFLIYLNINEIVLVVSKTEYRRGYSIVESNDFCRSIIHTIYNLTVNKNSFDPQNVTFENLKIEGEKLYKDNKFPEALTFFNKALKLNTEDPKIHYFLSQIYKKKGDDKLEFEFLDKAKKLNPIDVSIIIAIGNYHYKRKEYDLAEENYNKVITDPDNKYSAIYNLGLVTEQMKNKSEALKLYSLIPTYSHLYGKARKRISIVSNSENPHILFFIILGFILTVVLFYFLFRKNKINSVNPILDLEPDTVKLIKEEIGNGDIESAINMIKFAIQSDNKDKESLVLQIESRWNQLKEQEINDTIYKDDLQIEKNKITASLLNILN